MKKGYIVIGILLLLLVVNVVGYNNLVNLETTVDASWAQVENQLQRRADLIPNLVATVKGYAAHEQGIFTEIADARARLLGAAGPQEQIEANQGLESALGRLLAIAESYPQLKADANFIRLQDELAGTENKIAYERMRYNEAVQNWNRTIKQFPAVIIARIFGKSDRLYFEVDDSVNQVPQVGF